MQVVGQLALALACVELGGDARAPSRDRVAPAVDPERPEPDAVGAELAMKHVRGATRRHRDGLRLDPAMPA